MIRPAQGCSWRRPWEGGAGTDALKGPSPEVAVPLGQSEARMRSEPARRAGERPTEGIPRAWQGGYSDDTLKPHGGRRMK